MAFYEALHYVLTTACGRIRRIGWEPGTYVCRGFKNKCMGIVLVTTNKDGSLNYDAFTAKSEDMLAKDWCIIVEG